jgi:hypothetical protein
VLKGLSTAGFWLLAFGLTTLSSASFKTAILSKKPEDIPSAQVFLGQHVLTSENTPSLHGPSNYIPGSRVRHHRESHNPQDSFLPF